ncbi:MAG: UDP-N-acetylmuramate dehydrogenase, partial [Anaerolineales bacterium]|nr:UDP-N-acetylmuramate dehydrogenase [Anaerolineales bacterium]
MGFGGMEWAAGIPGTVGGAVVGNAGAHGGDTAGNLILAEVLHHTGGRQSWPPDRLAYDYRTSILKTES